MNLRKEFFFIDQIEELAAMPTIALDIMGMLNDPSSSTKHIVEKVQLDQAMISYILKNCNSPLYGIRNDVTSIAMAVNLLGFSQMKSILMSYFMRNLYRLSGRNAVKDSLWKHSIAVAVLAKTLAPKMNCNPEEAYLAGLLHDIGKMALYLGHPKNYEHVIHEVGDDADRFIEIEKKFFQFSHVEAGQYLVEKWNFSEMLKMVVKHHHDDAVFTGKEKIIGVVIIANHLSYLYVEKSKSEIGKYMKDYNLRQDVLDKVVEESLPLIEEYLATI